MLDEVSISRNRVIDSGGQDSIVANDHWFASRDDLIAHNGTLNTGDGRKIRPDSVVKYVLPEIGDHLFAAEDQNLAGRVHGIEVVQKEGYAL